MAQRDVVRALALLVREQGGLCGWAVQSREGRMTWTSEQPVIPGEMEAEGSQPIAPVAGLP